MPLIVLMTHPPSSRSCKGSRPSRAGQDLAEDSHQMGIAGVVARTRASKAATAG